MELTDFVANDDILEPETLDKLFPKLNPMEREFAFVIKVLLKTDTIFEDMDVFENAVTVLNKISPDVTKTEGVRPEWIWQALRIINKMRPDAEFTNEIYEYIKFVMKDNGIKFMPTIKGFPADPYLDVIIEKSKHTPLEETVEGIQAMRYLKIVEYLKGQ